MRKRQHARKPRNGPMVVRHLENVTRVGLDKFRESVFELLKDARGIYVLYGDRRPYFIGLIDSFAGRLDMHLKDWKWDTASVYLVGEECNVQDLETLLLKASVPDGNRKAGGFIGSRDMKPEFRHKVAEQQKKEIASIIVEGELPSEPSVKREETGPVQKPAAKPEPEKAQQGVKEPAEPEEKAEVKGKRSKARRRPKGKRYVLASYAKKGFEIRFWYKGRLVTAMVEKDGSIKYGEKSFSSPSLAASEIMGRTANGWMVWKYERSPGEWVLLNELKQNQ